MDDEPGIAVDREADWRTIVGERDLAVYAAAGYGRPAGPGRSPALFVIDVTYAFTGRERLPIMEAIKEDPNACGDVAWDAVDAIRRLLPAARALPGPVIYSAGFAALGERGLGMWRSKNTRAVESQVGAHDIVTEIAPGAGDLVISKTKPSLFHGTPLVDLLLQEGIDTIVVTGGTTSGCVRATVIDAFSYNFRVLVVEEGVFDRGELSHAVNLFDMHQKYADVVSVDEAVAYLESVAR